MNHRSTRLKIAMALAGQGAAKDFCNLHGLDTTQVWRYAAGRRRNERVNTLIDAFIIEQFAQHHDVLDYSWDEAAR